MEQDGYVSLWIGKSESDEELLNYVETDYTEDGDCLPSQFLKDFNIDIDDFDEDYIERVCLENDTNSVSEIIDGCSYGDIVVPEFEKMVDGIQVKKINSGILLYNFKYDGSVEVIKNKNYEFRYIGTVKYM